MSASAPMFHSNPAIDAFQGPLANPRIDQAVFHYLIIFAESGDILSEGPDLAGLVLLNKRGEGRRIGGIKDVITITQKLHQYPNHGVACDEGLKDLFSSESWSGLVLADGVASAAGVSPKIRVRGFSVKGDGAPGRVWGAAESGVAAVSGCGFAAFGRLSAACFSTCLYTVSREICWSCSAGPPFPADRSEQSRRGKSARVLMQRKTPPTRLASPRHTSQVNFTEYHRRKTWECPTSIRQFEDGQEMIAKERREGEENRFS